MADQEAPLRKILLPSLLLLLLIHCCNPCGASAGDRDPDYSSCVRGCETSGCVDGACFSPCAKQDSQDSQDTHQLQLMKLISWDCPGECRYQCMVRRESERAAQALEPLKYHGKWPFQRLSGIQEPASVLFSALNLLVHLWGLTSFMVLVHRHLPQGRKGSYYDFAGLWTIYGLLSINTWFWSAIFHTRDTATTESWDYSSAIATLGFSSILAIIRTLTIRAEATRVMVSAPFIGFIATHICYLNFYEFDYGWNMTVCVTLGLVQMLSWLVWATVSRHASRWKVWTVVLGTLGAMLLELYDFPPWKGYLDAHALWHLSTVPLTWLWWSFVRDDASLTVTRLLKRNQVVKKVD